MNKFYACELDILTVSEANSREHWLKKGKRHTAQKWAIKAEFNDKIITLPCIVKLSRISPRLLDSDNLQMAFKWIRDQLAECIIYPYESGLDRYHKGAGRYDDDPRISWLYAQEKGKIQHIRIEIFV
jgi:hypothetical protein